MATENILVSVIISLYNAEKYIHDAIKSVLDQTFQDFEIVVVNDGSTDNGAAVVKKMMKADDRIRFFEQENKGQCAASNHGFKESKGRYIKFFDADDLLTPETLERQVNVLKNKSEFEASYIDYLRFYDDDLSTTDRYKLAPLIDKDCTTLEYIKFHGTPPMYSNAIWLFNRKIFDHSGLWDERLSLSNDTEFFPRVLRHIKRLYYAPGCKLLYRTNFLSGSLSQKISDKSMESAVLAADLMATYLRGMETSPAIEKIIAQSYAALFEMAYPTQPRWAEILEKKLAGFDKEFYQLSGSGKMFSIATKVGGWKFAKRLQVFYYKMRYE